MTVQGKDDRGETEPTSNAREDLAALAEKYETLAAMRRAHDGGQPAPPRGEIRAFAARFPGALFELDTLPLDIIDGRARALRLATGGAGPVTILPWMMWMVRYHALVRADLARRRAGRSASGPRTRATSLAIATIAAESAATVDEVESALFARRRRGVTR